MGSSPFFKQPIPQEMSYSHVLYIKNSFYCKLLVLVTKPYKPYSMATKICHVYIVLIAMATSVCQSRHPVLF